MTPNTKTAEEILTETINKYNSSVNDMSKFSLSQREFNMFVTMMSEYATLKSGEQWVFDRTPDNTESVLGLQKLMNGKYGRVIVSYTKGHEIEFDDDDPQGEYDPIEERDGKMYLKPGWYELEEQIQSEYDQCWMPREITVWRELPSPPKQVEK